MSDTRKLPPCPQCGESDEVHVHNPMVRLGCYRCSGGPSPTWTVPWHDIVSSIPVEVKASIDEVIPQWASIVHDAVELLMEPERRPDDCSMPDWWKDRKKALFNRVDELMDATNRDDLFPESPLDDLWAYGDGGEE